MVIRPISLFFFFHLFLLVGGYPISLKGDQPWILTRRTNTEAEAPVFWSLDANRLPIGKDPDAGKDRGQKEKRASENEMAGWHHQSNEHELGQTPGDGGGQGGLVRCSPWGCKEVSMTGNWGTTTKLSITLQVVKSVAEETGGKEYWVGSCYSESNWKGLFRKMKVKLRLYKQKDKPEQMWVLLYEIWMQYLQAERTA